ncbi:discoidin domain-containing protein [Tamlana agarivorans]|uniref:Discoidin domain-containing protein n=1 Tax=Pseudotamlana agarivorans TaxID=481183 RepID=A0ACC5U9K1_9FLAO|nr:discoidin domain-containing protein [Tamlana agarivorans]
MILSITLSMLCFSQTVGPWDLDELYEVPEWEATTLAQKDGVTSLLFSSLDYLGNPVQVFAYYSAPSGTMPAGGWPAMVHAHGGGGTAYSQWVNYFNDQGYAAISLDLEGHIPTEDANGAYLPSPNPGPSRSGVFNDYANPVEEQWFYHAIAQVIIGHTLIGSFPEVNANKIGLSGASWGGTITSTAMGVDNRWSWAIPVYGAGYLDDSDGAQGNNISGAKADFVNQYYDASVYFDRVDFPVLFINGTNDYNFAMPVTQNSAKHVNGNILFSLRFGHSNLAPLRLDELYTFANQVTYGTDALPAFGSPSFDASNVATVNVASEAGLSSAELLYTLDDGYWYEREWLATTATISGNILSATLPENTVAFYFAATDSRGLMTTSEYVETHGGTIPSGNPNVAIYGTASQSSTDYSGEASRAIDQNASGVYSDGSVSHTSAEDNAWWQVDLVGSHSIDEIVVFNRTDAGYQARMTNFTVYIINSDDEITFSQSFNNYPDPSVTIEANGAVGSVVKVQLDATNTPLTLAEVQVYEVENTPVSVTSVGVSPENASVAVGNSLLLMTTVTPLDATDQTVNWRSSNSAVATVNETTGLVTALSTGSAIITATTTDGEFTDNSFITVTSTSSGSDNLAIYGTASQSSTAYGGQASRAIDGNSSGVWSESSTTHTANETNPWWEVDLGSARSIGDIVVFGRTDSCCKTRLTNFTVTVMDGDRNTVFSQAFTAFPDPSIAIETGDVIGQIVQVQIDGTNPLSLAEVEVYAGVYEVSNLALNGTASQSTTAYTGEASRAIDGNTTGGWNAGSVTHTEAISNSWWMVNLNGNYTIEEVTIFNRTDTRYMSRLNNFTLEVLNNEDNVVYTQTITSTPNPSVTINVGEVTGNRVRISQNKASTALSLAEVEVYGSAASVTAKSSLDKTNMKAEYEPVFKIFPNPVENFVTVKLEMAAISAYKLINITGQVVLSGVINHVSNVLDLTSFTPGVYFLEVSNGTITQRKRVVKK